MRRPGSAFHSSTIWYQQSVRSNIATAQVSVIGGVFTTDACVVGKIFVDCNGNQVPDAQDIEGGTSPDCNANGVEDSVDISSGASDDCTGNGVPDECEPDGDGNGIPDECDVGNCPPEDPSCQDCNADGRPDIFVAATYDDNRPRFCPAASTTYHSRVMSFSFKLYVFTLLLLEAGYLRLEPGVSTCSPTCSLQLPTFNFHPLNQ